MARAYAEPDSLRLGRRDSERLIVAFVLSAIVHSFLIAGYYGNKKDWFAKWHVPTWLHRLEQVHPVLIAKPLTLPVTQETEPTTFVDVSHADTDVPAQPKFYSNKNSHAANEIVANTQAPRIEGRQQDMPKTEDVPKLVKQGAAQAPQPPSKEPPAEQANASKEQAAKSTDAEKSPDLQPTMPPMTLPPPSLARTMPAPAPEAPQTAGETEAWRPRTIASTQGNSQAPSQDSPQRPRTLRQALAKNEQLPGQQMQQSGGVPVHRMWSSLNAKAVPFGDYDRQLIEAVQQRWDDLLESHQYAEDRAGKVMLRFKLKPDGTIIEMETVESSVGELLSYLCQESIEEAAPFSKWPPDMERMIGTNYREVTFTFYYY